MTWSDELVGALTYAHSQGKSAGLIAKELGLTRNQVIGKAWRLGLAFDKTTRRLSSKRWPVSHGKIVSRDWERALTNMLGSEAA
jgi:hypothetical protein